MISKFFNAVTSSIAAVTVLPIAIQMARTVNKIHLSPEELYYIAAIVKKKTPCRFLVFGLGNDSPFWTKLNQRGRTIFIENLPEWFSQIKEQHPDYFCYLVNYGTHRSEWKDLIDSPEKLMMNFPPEIELEKFDCILVDGPHGWKDTDPGRMKSILAASRLVKVNGDVFVHDCDRVVEKAYCDRYLSSGILINELGRLRHYHLPLALEEN